MLNCSRLLGERKIYKGLAGNKSIGYIADVALSDMPSWEYQLLKKEGCRNIFFEEKNKLIPNGLRPEFNKALSLLLDGDELVTDTLWSLGSNKKDIFSRLASLESKGIHVRTLDGLVNTKLLGQLGPLIIGMFVGFANLDKPASRSNEVRKKSDEIDKVKSGGRPKVASIKEKLVVKLREEGYSYRLIREQTSLSLTTIRRIIVDYGVSK